jgi:hypothetical protein
MQLCCTCAAAAHTINLPCLVQPCPACPSRAAISAAASPARHCRFHPAGLGLLSPLPDELLLELLFGLPAADLARLGLASKALYCFAHTSELWKALVIQVCGVCRPNCCAAGIVCMRSRHAHACMHSKNQLDCRGCDVCCAAVELLAAAWLGAAGCYGKTSGCRLPGRLGLATAGPVCWCHSSDSNWDTAVAEHISHLATNIVSKPLS